MFYTPKPHKFDYQPRFYDPKKEELEKAKRRYAGTQKSAEEISDEDLEYYKKVVESFDEPEKKEKATSIFHRKELPTFNYKPRFSGGENTATMEAESEKSYKKDLKFRKSWLAKRDSMDMEPVPASKVFLYAIVVFLLLLWIFL